LSEQPNFDTVTVVFAAWRVVPMLRRCLAAGLSSQRRHLFTSATAVTALVVPLLALPVLGLVSAYRIRKLKGEMRALAAKVAGDISVLETKHGCKLAGDLGKMAEKISNLETKYWRQRIWVNLQT